MILFNILFLYKTLTFLAKTITKECCGSVHYTNTMDIDFFKYIKFTVIKRYKLLFFKRQNVITKIIKFIILVGDTRQFFINYFKIVLESLNCKNQNYNFYNFG